jgi:hypothetical protein
MRGFFILLVILSFDPSTSSQVTPTSFFGALSSVVVSEVQKIFVVRDGSTVQSSVDPVVLSAVYGELLSLSGNFSSLATLEDIRNASLFHDGELVRLVLLAVMGNFHSQTLQDANFYNDVQVVYDPVGRKFVTRQNMRETELVVFQVLLVISVSGVLMVFLLGNHHPGNHHSGNLPPKPDGKAEDSKPKNVSLNLSQNLHTNRLAMPAWTLGGGRALGRSAV